MGSAATIVAQFGFGVTAGSVPNGCKSAEAVGFARIGSPGRAVFHRQENGAGVGDREGGDRRITASM